MLLYIISFIIIILILFILIQIKVEINANLLPTVENNNISKDNHYIKFIIFGFIPIFKINLDSKKRKRNKRKNKNKTINTIAKIFSYFLYSEKLNKVLFTRKDFKRLNNSVFFHKLDVNLGLNLQNYILNAYIISIINAAFNIYMSANFNNFNLSKTKYYTYISKEIYNLDIYCIISIKLVNTIDIIFKAIYNYRKVVSKNGTRTTSNRKSYDDSNDISREYGRC